MPLLSAPEVTGKSQQISLWAPNAQRIVYVVADGVRTPMRAGDGGWWHSPEPLTAGTRYSFSVDGGDERPDPRSVYQPEGVHGPSEVVDLGSHTWGDGEWKGRPLKGGVIYEMHVGTFTEGGTFDSAIEHLDYLVDLGVTHVEVLPVNAFPGHHNWGYDGVGLYATAESYGGPLAFQRFVDAAHAKGLAVILDVVYNHLGPTGNYLPVYGPYFNDAHNTPWGAGVNLDGPHSDPVRAFFIQNALQWFEIFHVDGFRFDAVHALVDESAVHFLEEMSAQVEAAADRAGREVVLIAESDRNDPATVTPRHREPMVDGVVVAAGGSAGRGFSAQWADDFHHALHVLLTGETQGYYEDFATPGALEKVFSTPFFHDGTYSSFRGRRHGRPVDPAVTPGWRFVASLQTHDQVGNRADGDRLSQLIPFGRLACGAALLLTSPYTPMLFMGEEWGSSTPWQFFTDHTDPEIAAATSAGRAAEFATHGWGESVPDPQDPETFRRSRLDWNECQDSSGDHALLLEWYRTLLKLRREIPSLSDPDLTSARIERAGEGTASVVTLHRGDYRVVANLSNDAVRTDGEVVAAWHTVSVHEPTQHDAGFVEIPADSVAILR